MARTVFLWISASLLIPYAAAEEKPIPVKVVVVTMFERGADTGDEPGEFQYLGGKKQARSRHPVSAGLS